MTARTLPRIERTVLTDSVHETLTRLIMDHDLAPDQRVNIDALARDLGVSPTPVREALTRLEAEGLVTKEPLRGWFTSPLLSSEDLHDMYEFRLLFEPWAAARAAENVDDEWIGTFREEFATARSAPTGSDYDSYRGLTRHDAVFHRLIAERSGNKAVVDALEHTHCHLHIFRLRYADSFGPSTVDEHAAIVDAVTAGDPDAAADAMRTHLRSALARLEPVAQDRAATTRNVP